MLLRDVLPLVVFNLLAAMICLIFIRFTGLEYLTLSSFYLVFSGITLLTAFTLIFDNIGEEGSGEVGR